MKLPYWDLNPIFPGLDSPEFVAAKRKSLRDIGKLETFVDSKDIRAGKKLKASPAAKSTLLKLLKQLDTFFRDFKDLRTYLHLIVATDAFNDKAQAELSSNQLLVVKLSMLNTRLTAYLGRFPESFIQSREFRAYQYPLQQAYLLSQHQMSEEAESLASQLFPSSSVAWGKLHDDLISRTTLEVNVEGKAKAYNLSELKNLQSHTKEAIRRRAFEAERKLLTQNEVSFAAALNGLKGGVSELTRLRGWSSALEQTLFRASVSPKALVAMQAACKEAFPVFRRYLKSKAKLLGKKRLAFYDLTAPLKAGKSKCYNWSEARAFTVKHFGNYSETLANFAEKTFAENWHDVPPRKGKTNGAFCASIPGRKASRIMHNFDGSLDSLFTIAHELGHAYHNECLYRAGRTMLQSDIPMTLAETASIFCETIVVNALLETTQGEEKLNILEQDLQGATALVVDIHSRFILEHAVFEKRRERELSVQELKDIMLNAQKETYGDGLGVYHDLMWAHKGHYYIPGMDYYNFPYTFGYLFALGLYAEYQKRPQGFHQRYDQLLSSSGMASASDLAKGFGIDIENIEFWRGSLSVPSQRVLEFEQLAKQLV